jgi:hypothetical protein
LVDELYVAAEEPSTKSQFSDEFNQLLGSDRPLKRGLETQMNDLKYQIMILVAWIGKRGLMPRGRGLQDGRALVVSLGPRFVGFGVCFVFQFVNSGLWNSYKLTWGSLHNMVRQNERVVSTFK